ncbi:Gfo/Idh/MocA family oxidoreductase [Lachnospiraceae bacterium MD1]|uniref:Gfo/Idh/MocA family oxidoreductase n=1 Tax=Variimorphobacter saccharofermentans TaxID=2755051 RepID=A0A839JXT0_9FIRM|nr:Gfo/Idh/MocA family oxidoreductase [Variimorphobacter saccharofermentans]MBB2182473.1 Gfo/Idh/MocA family oxidoreductase [Variimorphobacter saccharofermentans]
MKVVKWGIIGPGSIASSFATALASMEHTEITAVASRSIDRAKEFAERFHVKKAYGSYEELVNDPEIDVVYIGTPHSEHKAHAALCISNKKSVLCEKPITINQEDAKYLINLAREHRVFLMEAMWTKFLPVTKTVKQWLNDKVIGEIKYMNISFGFQNAFDAKSRLFNPDLAGGALLDVGIYPISYAIHLMGKLPDQVVGSAYLGKSNVDEMNVISFVYNEGVMASLSSAISTNTGCYAVIIGDKGRIEVPEFYGADTAMRYDEQGTLVERFHHKHPSNGYVYEAEEVNRCIREGKMESDIIPLRDTLDIMKIMDDLRSSWGLQYPQENNRK